MADPDAALATLLPLIEAMPRTEVVEMADGYLHATVSSALFGFVDDLELYADKPHGLLQVRSVSRLGDSDLGVNRRRLDTLRLAAWETAAKQLARLVGPPWRSPGHLGVPPSEIWVPRNNSGSGHLSPLGPQGSISGLGSSGLPFTTC
jgi:hypothetical protein